MSRRKGAVGAKTVTTRSSGRDRSRSRSPSSDGDVCTWRAGDCKLASGVTFRPGNPDLARGVEAGEEETVFDASGRCRSCERFREDYEVEKAVEHDDESNCICECFMQRELVGGVRRAKRRRLDVWRQARDLTSCT